MDEKPWHKLKESTLLEKRISEFDLKIEGTSLEHLIQKLYRELEAKGLQFKPPCFLADEWFCPVNIPAIGIPFYLAHSKLRGLEQKNILEVEGGTKAWFMRLIRHEAGHAYSYAYRLHKKKNWKGLFGSSSQEYLDTYRPRPHSRSFVLHLDNWYAQSHPDEDFAETFAVWLTPNSRWKTQYKGWKVLQKLQYVDKLMGQIQRKPLPHQPRFRSKDHSGLNIKLKTYFHRKRKMYAESYPDFYDRDLRVIFTDEPEKKSNEKGWRYLNKNKQKIVNAVAFWTKEKKYTISDLLDNLIERCKELNLYAPKENDTLDFKISSCVSSLIMNYLFTGQFKRSK